MDIISPDFRGGLQAAIEAAREAAFPCLVAAPDPTLPRAKVSGTDMMTVRYTTGFTSLHRRDPIFLFVSNGYKKPVPLAVRGG